MNSDQTEPGASLQSTDALVHAPAETLPDLHSIVIEDGKPAESIFVEKQRRLLVEPLYSSWTGAGPGRSFQAFANVGLFFAVTQPILDPDVMVSLDVQCGDLSKRENQSYFVWMRGKAPEVVVEVVANDRGGELAEKMTWYARAGVLYYAVFDPACWLKGETLCSFRLVEGEYQPLTAHFFPRALLGVTLWEGKYEQYPACWLRWCDVQGKLIPTAREREDEARQRTEHFLEQQRRYTHQAEQERQRIKHLEARLRELGLEP